MVNLAQRWILTVLLCNWIPLVIYAKGKTSILFLDSICYLLPSHMQQTTSEIIFRSAQKVKKRKTIAYVFVIITWPEKLYFYISPKPYLVY